MTLYALLNASAKNWWYHKDLRTSGHNIEARRRERKAILSDVELIKRMRAVKHSRVQVMPGRHLCFIPGTCVQSGYEPELWFQISKICGLTCIDTREVDEDTRFRVCMSVPDALPEFCAAWAEVGAVVLNAPKE